MVRVDRAPYGGAREAPFRLPYGPAKADSLLRTLERHVRNSGSRPIDTPAATRDVRPPAYGPTSTEGPSQIGQTLFGALLPPPLREGFLQCLGWTEGRPDRALRLRLVLDPSCPEQAAAQALPWELLYRAETRDFLSRSVMTPVVRQLEAPRLRIHDVPTLPLRVLVVVSSPRGVPYLDLEQERQRIDSAWGSRKDVHVEFLKTATIAEARRALRDEPIHVLHFMGHGAFDAQSGEGALLFETSAGEQHTVSGQVLAATLDGSRALRLVFLNACETAQLPRRGGQDPYTGAASALVMGGVPMVLAMQFSISDTAAITFSEAFYSALAAGDLVETATSEGRLAVYRVAPSSWEWITPVLFMSMEEGRILEPSATEQTEDREMSTFNPTINNSESVIFGEKVHVEGGVHVHRAPSPAEEAKHYRELGAENLESRNYEAAARSLKTAADRTGSGDEDHYALALATLAGRRPFKLTRPEIREIENHIERALKLKRQPHYLLFLAFLKYDYFVLRGMPAGEPNCEALLSQGVAGRPDPVDVRKLLAHLPQAPNNPILQKITDLA